jgi:hypothetical protein
MGRINSSLFVIGRRFRCHYRLPGLHEPEAKKSKNGNGDRKIESVIEYAEPALAGVLRQQPPKHQDAVGKEKDGHDVVRSLRAAYRQPQGVKLLLQNQR